MLLLVIFKPWYWIVLENKGAKVKSSDRKHCVNLDALNYTERVQDNIQMTNQDFANLFKTPEKEENSKDAKFMELCRSISSEICYSEKDAAMIEMDYIVDENRRLKEQLGVYMEKAGRLEHEYNMLMDEKICVSNELAWLKELNILNNV
jgi:hypothetical protein